MTENRFFSSFSLHIIAMLLMLTDHLRFAFPDAGTWLCAVGRTAFPIFAFMTAEGIKNTGDVKKYALRLLVLAIVSELPFDLMRDGTALSFARQNVIWTLLLSVIAVSTIARSSGRPLTAVIITAAAFAAAELCRVDYGGFGVTTVLLFYFLKRDTVWDKLTLAVCFMCLNTALAAVDRLWIQLFALLALPVIFCYDGTRGRYGKLTRLLFYGFYPLHMLAVWALS